MTRNEPVRPRGNQPRILLSSVFGPYGQDDEYGSRTLNPMELYQNQVTRVQGGFSLRMFHRSFGLMMIQANIDAPSTLLDFPSLDRFAEEIRRNDYDIVGISAIIPNVGKVKKMCDLIRKHGYQASGCPVGIWSPDDGHQPGKPAWRNGGHSHSLRRMSGGL